MNRFKGIPASEGIAIGKAFVYDLSKPKIVKKLIPTSKIAEEIEKFRSAINKTEEYVNYTKELSLANMESDYSFIFDIYLLFLKDSMLVDETIKLIRDNLYTAEYALVKVSESIMASFEESDDEYLKERKNDIEHITNKLLTFMMGDILAPDRLEEGSVVIAHDLSPSQLVQFIHMGINGFATDMGSKVTHTSIIARAVNLPSVVGLSNISKRVETGDLVIIDAFEGYVIVNPTDAEINRYKGIKERYLKYVDGLKCDFLPDKIKTKDGVGIKILLNIEINEEINPKIVEITGGIGLYRTEFIYLTKGDVKEDEQFEILKQAVVAAKGRPVVIRTFDLGGEKLSSLLPHPEEVNPALGLRAIRYSLRFKDFFRKQLRAIIRASAFGNVSIMFPMVSTLGEIIEAKEIMEAVKTELIQEGFVVGDIKVGIMVELPSAALMADELAKHVDFFSVGTNDLTQYTLGVDRNNEYVADLFDPIHPSILYLLERIIQSAEREGIEATICGEMAGDPLFIPVLLGLGYRSLSMSPTNVLKVIYVINHLNIADCKELVKRLRSFYMRGEHYKLLKEFATEHFKGVYFND
ncbi:MAG: phosphoenolpyruvate--protein phosphotransferase [Calditerrivibrio sp.]|nr:phosphoenolpyruvate--protein phosphotransferase [Calditerrivibrio sp.]